MLFEPLPLAIPGNLPNNEFQVNATDITVATVTNPDVGVSANGQFVVVWVEPDAGDSNIKFRRFALGFNEDSQLTTLPLDDTDRIVTADPLINETEPAIAVAPDGRFVVAYTRNTNNGDIFVQRFDADADGTTLGPAISVATTTLSNSQDEPDIAINANGDFVVVWSHDNGTSQDILGRWYRADGTPINGTDVIISNSLNREENDASVAMISETDNPGDFSTVVSWTEETLGGPTDIFFERFDSNGNSLGGKVSAVSPGNQLQDQSQSSITIDADGNFAIAWNHQVGPGNDDIHFRRFDSTGTAIDATEIIVDNSLGDQDEPVIDVSPDGHFVIAYEDDTDNSVKFRQFDSDGSSLGNSTNYDVSSNDEDNPAIAISDNNMMMIVADDDLTNAFEPHGRVFGGETSTDLGPITLTAGTAQIAYVAYYGRPADADVGDENFWDGVLRQNNVSYSPRGGDPLTGDEEAAYNRIVNNFGNSDEANRLFGGLNNTERVNLVYNHAFGRDAEPGGLDYWVPRLNDGRVTLPQFALSIALGAQNQDIVSLRNKLESAIRFSGSIDTVAEREAYRGGNAETFGREFLGNYGPTIAPQSIIDQSLADFVASVSI